MKIGTRSILYGAHQFAIHPWFVAAAWWRLYGFPWDPRLWVAFFIHDLGYFGMPNMDGPEGETHPQFGARVMSALFDGRWRRRTVPRQSLVVPLLSGEAQRETFVARLHGRPAPDYCRTLDVGPWGLFVLLHSRFYAKQLGLQPSRLCVADKLAIVLTPAWLYLPMTRWTGEIDEYMGRSAAKESGTPEGNRYAHMNVHDNDPSIWYRNMQDYVRRWVSAHKDGQADTWTPPQPRRSA